MPSYNYSFRAWEFRPISFSADRMNTVGQAAVDSSRARIMSGLDVKDAPAMPLSRSYAKRKVRAGQPPIRNWTLTGALMASMGVQRTVLNSVSIGFTSTDAIKLQRLAAWNSRVEQMTGISPRDQANISSVMQSEFSDEVERRNR
jgi:PAS domain-containing protein